MGKLYYVYILTNRHNTVLYIGITGNLEKRVYEHKHRHFDGFTKKYNLDKLVYYECSNHPNAAINREKQLKKWRRKWKNELIERENPGWIDLSADWRI